MNGAFSRSRILLSFSPKNDYKFLKQALQLAPPGTIDVRTQLITKELPFSPKSVQSGK